MGNLLILRTIVHGQWPRTSIFSGPSKISGFRRPKLHVTRTIPAAGHNLCVVHQLGSCLGFVGEPQVAKVCTLTRYSTCWIVSGIQQGLRFPCARANIAASHPTYTMMPRYVGRLRVKSTYIFSRWGPIVNVLPSLRLSNNQIHQRTSEML